MLTSGRKSETTGSMRANRLGDYAGMYLCQSLLFITLEEKLILVYRTRVSLTLALRHHRLPSCIISCKFITFEHHRRSGKTLKTEIKRGLL